MDLTNQMNRDLAIIMEGFHQRIPWIFDHQPTWFSPSTNWHRNPSITSITNVLCRACREDIVIFEKNLFLSYSEWSPKLKDLLSSNAKIMAFQRRAYALYKERFAPGELGGDDPSPRLCEGCGSRYWTIEIDSDRSHVQSYVLNMTVFCGHFLKVQ